MSQHTSLATIPNRYAFIDSVVKRASQSTSISLMLVDVVRFSDVTTSLGIHVGDRFLLEIANRIQHLFGQHVLIGRISGDVFGIVFPNENKEAVMRQMFERLVEHFKTPMHYDGTAFIADFNVGVVCGEKDGFEITAFISRAESALKQAKENKYENYFALTKSDKSDTGRSLALKADLKRALSQNELELYYQPKVDLNTLHVVGAECLLRWNHPLDGVLFPGPLIEAAESYNMMNELGYWTLEQAFRALAELDVLRMPIVLSVNISPTQLYDNQLIPTLTMLSDTYGLPLSLIELELTEDVALSNSLMVKKQLDELRSLGVAISVDDFGKGYSNLAYIRDLDIDALKIDKSFVMELETHPVNRAIIEAAKVIGRAKGCCVVAEGIETVEQLHILREVGISQGQGYLFSRAVPFTEFVQLTQQEIIIGSSPRRAQA
ncbi:bifunctional diguanylate cyclase/phosphodiesterase [Alteromonas sp. BL110]|uniref:putative bifunctional diguanylate cyclase/phosphodiesterase n=1 Tax=Alteromonas sp. BL110 TaxID=1714845 RepID=UPI000E5451EF|nr:bifunctional diguanylate cyclase/phosphodiesterase [Alteromonas sp. BL110]AXT37292.1 bifunctional diguanylate cyclase/phosphodiesterase [Alteromonas sp. BL110]RKM80030.1 EAL domain-containing protein [Alteromonas sp. BL110]